MLSLLVNSHGQPWMLLWAYPCFAREALFKAVWAYLL